MSDDPREEVVSIDYLRDAIAELRSATVAMRVEFSRPPPQVQFPLPGNSEGWTFATYDRFVTQRLTDLTLQLQQRHEAQQTSVATAMVAAEKAVNAALVAAEKAVDKSEQAQALRNAVSNEFRSALSDLSNLMWSREAGTLALESVRRELESKMATLQDRIAHLQASDDAAKGKREGITASMAGFLAVAGLLISLGVGAMEFLSRSVPPAVSVSAPASVQATKP